MELNLDDLQPSESSFTLSEYPGRVFVLKKFSLAARIWTRKRFGDGLSDVFEKKDLAGLCEIAHNLLKDPKDKVLFPTFLAFAEAVMTTDDYQSISKALLQTVGIDDKLILEMAAKIEADEKKAEVTQTEAIGPPPLISSPLNTDGVSTNS